MLRTRPVRKTPFLGAIFIVYRHDHFTKTGSGQTQEKFPLKKACCSAGDVVYKQDNMKMDVPRKTITLDGAFPEWECAEVKAQTPFYPYNNLGDKVGSHCCGNQLTMFDDYNGKVAWDPSDQSVAISFAWDPQNFYVGVKVKKTRRLFCAVLTPIMVILPRRARDGYRENTQKETPAFSYRLLMTRMRTTPAQVGTATLSRSPSPTPVRETKRLFGAISYLRKPNIDPDRRGTTMAKLC
jgi:hypothetical protein